MWFANLAASLSRSSVSTTLRDGIFVFPLLIIFHILSIAIFGASIIFSNLRVLGLALQEIPVSKVMGQLKPWKWTGFAALAVTGTLLSLCDPVEYHDNPMYWLTFLVLVIIGIDAMRFRSGVYQHVAEWDTAITPPKTARSWAMRSMVLWASLVFIGRAIAFF